MHSKNLKQNGRKILGMHDNSGEVKKKVSHLLNFHVFSFNGLGLFLVTFKLLIVIHCLIAQVTQAQDKNLKGLVSCVAVTKLKTTNPKPFRLRTDASISTTPFYNIDLSRTAMRKSNDFVYFSGERNS